ncbi:MAG: tRNA 2-thiouridine(34) synthase MnmA [Candidatus Doudnabacteria bacterium]|nr:tRNA 2-thiouridine(34) synthase MnmA [Candidatus Doudnabacteria bacterium]
MKENNRKKKVVVGMSGGVDSSVTAALLKQQGFHVIGVFMKNWSDDVGDYGCTWAADAEDARKAAEILKIPFYVWNFEKEYYKRVVGYFLREYKAGRTPNPDVMCNKEIKFKVFLEKALSLGADFVATGHYARIQKSKIKSQNDNAKVKIKLLKGIDPAKDQSYFLYTLQQDQLSKILFPIGDYKKSQVRELAKKFKLPNFAKKDSQGICFIGKINVREFLQGHIKARKGEIVTTAGKVVGKHIGLPFYTIGQREGIGLGGNGPYYVAEKKLEKNQLVVTNNVLDGKLWKREFEVADVSWTGTEPKFPLKAGITIRYHHPDYPGEIRKKRNGNLGIKFKKSQRAITIGQAAVIYKGEELLGGGIIKVI